MSILDQESSFNSFLGFAQQFASIEQHAAAGLRVLQTVPYRLEIELENLLAASFPEPGDADRVRQMFVESLVSDNRDMNSHRRGTEIHFGYPSLIVVSEHAS